MKSIFSSEKSWVEVAGGEVRGATGDTAFWVVCKFFAKLGFNHNKFGIAQPKLRITHTKLGHPHQISENPRIASEIWFSWQAVNETKMNCD